MNLDRECIYIQRPGCNFYARPFLRQVRNQETIICGGCKGNHRLVDHLAQHGKTERRVGKALEALNKGLGNMTINLKL